MNRDLVALKLSENAILFLERARFNPCSAYHNRRGKLEAQNPKFETNANVQNINVPNRKS